jgi:prepilin-type N-terminal cleavage/methylation domain-containing protein
MKFNVRNSGGGIRCGFSLVELLAVMAIASVIFMATMFVRVNTPGRQVQAALDRTQNKLELARAYAMARNTYVWVGFRSFQQNLEIAVVAAGTGSSSDLGTGQTFPIQRIESLAGVMLADGSAAEVSVTESLIDPLNLGTIVFEHVLRFDPQGQASIGGDDVPGIVAIEFVPSATGEPMSGLGYLSVSGAHGIASLAP